MRLARIWLLVLLAVLLPIRGAAAVAMLCPNESTSMHQHQPALDNAQVMSHHHAMRTALDHGEAGGHHDHGNSGHGDKCNLCASCCTGTAMVTTFAPVFAPLAAASESFEAPASPALSFLSDGQERPPRTI